MRVVLVVGSCAVLFGGGPAHAAASTPAAQAEIDALLERLAASGCVFNRNGSWHSAAEACKHLADKREYLQRRGLVQTAEHFIERGASASSLSGRPYLVKCGSAAPMESGRWLMGQLERIRGAGTGAGSGADKGADKGADTGAEKGARKGPASPGN